MKLVVDTNILITFFWKESFFRSIIDDQQLDLYTPPYALTELEKFAAEIQKKTGLSEGAFKESKKMLCQKIQFIPLEEYTSYLLPAQQTGKGLTKEQYIDFLDDLDFVACAFALSCPLWSNDKLIKEKTTITVFTTYELILLLKK